MNSIKQTSDFFKNDFPRLLLKTGRSSDNITLKALKPNHANHSHYESALNAVYYAINQCENKDLFIDKYLYKATWEQLKEKYRKASNENLASKLRPTCKDFWHYLIKELKARGIL